ncbi:MAG: HDOD domain-containing protein [Acidimicrobiia bacterium]|nr:HDOD domain-containing protein [Acidimicrobiia bacterium]MDH5292768.1 HDOD domain-containing protein [Acidimicrobiia bacterium]
MAGLRRAKPDAGDALRRTLMKADLPTIPAVVTAAIDQVTSPDCDLASVASVISKDPGLTARMLSVVNSAAYAPRNPIVTVHQAVTMFGRNHVESMLISAAASSVVSAATARTFDLRRFWSIAAWRASAASSLSRIVDRSRSSENFTAALLEDIAVPILATQVPGYADTLRSWLTDGGDLSVVEFETHGWTHASAAGILFDEWRFPASLRDAVVEDPQRDDPDYPVVRAVSTLATPVDRASVIELTVARIGEAFSVSDEIAIPLLEEAYDDGASLARSLA